MTRIDAFMVSGTEPHVYPSGVHPVTCHAGVIATDIEDAIRAFKKAHPEAVLWTVSHRGQIEIITSDAMEAAGAAGDET